MTTIRIVKSIIVFILILLIAILPIGNKQFEKQLTAPPPYTEPVFKEMEPVVVDKIVEPVEQKKSEEFSDTDQFLEITKALMDARLNGATTGVSIRRASDGEIIYSQLGDTRVHPASLMKLLTGAAALEVLGLDYTFKTEVYMDGKINEGVLHGDLYLRGQGDPTLMWEDLQTLAADLKDKGIHTITGNLYGDDTWYDDERLSQDLNWSDEPYRTGAQISALTLSPNEDYDAGAVIIEVYPAAKASEPGIVRTVPDNDYMKIINQTKTIGRKGANTIKVKRSHGSNTLIVSGTIPLGLKQTRLWASVWEPTNYTVNLFKAALDEQDIMFSTVTKVGRGTVPSEATLLTSKQSMPLKELLIPFMKLSNNGHGEVLVKEMGRVIEGEGSWAKGLAVMDSTLAAMGINMETILLRDGSGMSHKNLVTANEVTKLLYVAQNKPWFPEFLKSQPVAGNADRFIGGTLRYRMNDTAAEGNVKAKTGYLNGVASLAGYVETKDGEELIFSVIINNHIDDTAYVVLDQIAIILANYKE